jgi:acyl CoA:acetate/3-ketoacid CoA transferase
MIEAVRKSDKKSNPKEPSQFAAAFASLPSDKKVDWISKFTQLDQTIVEQRGATPETKLVMQSNQVRALGGSVVVMMTVWRLLRASKLIVASGVSEKSGATTQRLAAKKRGGRQKKA